LGEDSNVSWVGEPTPSPPNASRCHNCVGTRTPGYASISDLASQGLVVPDRIFSRLRRAESRVSPQSGESGLSWSRLEASGEVAQLCWLVGDAVAG
jgi:hypothetical protein